MTSEFRLVDSNWEQEFDAALQADHSTLRVVCPFIKLRTAERLLKYGAPSPLLILTRFNGNDFCDGVSDLSALRLLLDHGAMIRGVRHLHAKLYLFGDTSAMITSANLTESALQRNLEFGCAIEDPKHLITCRQYFDDLWQRTMRDLTTVHLDAMASRVSATLPSGARRRLLVRLPDEGEDIGLPTPPGDVQPWVESSEQAFVKFYGANEDRELRTTDVIKVIKESCCYLACMYPSQKSPPSGVKEGAVMFLGRLVAKRNDTMIFGWAIAQQYQHGRDIATPAELALMPWNNRWHHLIRVHDGEFVTGTLENGVSLKALMDRFGDDAFASTQRNKQQGKGNLKPTLSIRNQPAVELSPRAFAWLRDRLEEQFSRHGKLTEDDLHLLGIRRP